MRVVMSNRIPEKIHELSDSYLPPYMNVGKRYAVVNFFEDSTTGYWYAPYNKIYVLCEIDWGGSR